MLVTCPVVPGGELFLAASCYAIHTTLQPCLRQVITWYERVLSSLSVCVCLHDTWCIIMCVYICVFMCMCARTSVCECVCVCACACVCVGCVHVHVLVRVWCVPVHVRVHACVRA